MIRRYSIQNAFLALLLFCLVLLFFFTASSSLSLWNMHQSNYDQNIYHIIGREWMNGHLPYVELSDIKGPVQFLYFGLASLITPDSFTGIALIHSITVTIGLIFAYKSARLFVGARPALLVLSIYISYIYNFAANPAELAWCMEHVVLYWFLKNKLHDDKSIYLFGLFIGLIVSTKFNLIAFFAPFGLLILFPITQSDTLSIKCKRCIIALCGFITVILPFAIYFYACDGLNSLVDEYFVTCIKYGSCPFTESAIAKENINLFSNLLPFPGSLLTRTLLIFPGLIILLGWALVLPSKIGHKAVIVLIGGLICTICSSFLGPYSFSHYFYALYPYCFLSILSFVIILKKLFVNINEKHIGYAALTVVLAVLLMNIGWAYFVNNHPRNGVAQFGNRNDAVAAFVGDASFVCIQSHCIVFYRTCNRNPGIKYFIPQMIEGGNEEYFNGLIEYIKNCRPKYILGTVNEVSSEKELISKTLLNYERVPDSEIGVSEPTEIEVKNKATIVWRLVGSE